ncbi:MAG TPA: hypothetical protein VEB64_02925, partial [Azospirillaceae bacterium]|nr:hypothetical protein [Azospirillaceae bacterium]
MSIRRGASSLLTARAARVLALSAALLVSACMATEDGYEDDYYSGSPYGRGVPSHDHGGYGGGHGSHYERDWWALERREREIWQRQRDLDSQRQRTGMREDEVRRQQEELRRQRETVAREREQLRQRETIIGQQEAIRNRPPKVT